MGDIDIRFWVSVCDILTRNVFGHVSIGQWSKGCIVATGTSATAADGRLDEVEVGRVPIPDATDTDVLVYANRGPGLCGIVGNTPVASHDPNDWFTATPRDGWSVDAGVFATGSIGSVSLASLSLSEFISQGASKVTAARIESPLIESLVIDDFVTGSVWSGVIDANDPLAVYAQIESFTANCVGRESAVWARDWSEFTVHENLFGHVHVPEIGVTQHIRIGRIFGEHAQYSGDETCRCSAWSPGTCNGCELANGLSEQSPRDPNYPECSGLPTDRGYIAIRDPEGFAGQITANSNATTLSASTLSTGAVYVGLDTNNCPIIEISPTASDPTTGPYYRSTPDDWGYGQVGLIATHLHNEDCEPPSNSAASEREFLNSAFCKIMANTRWTCETNADQFACESIILSFYDYVIAESANHIPVTVMLVVPGGPDIDVSGLVKRALIPAYTGGPSRQLRIWGDVADYAQLIAGEYYIVPNRTGNHRLLCDRLLPDAPVTPVAAFVGAGGMGVDRYVFWLQSDCNRNGVDDEDELSTTTDMDQSGVLDCCEIGFCDPDYNQDGVADQDDVAYLVNVLAGGGNPTGRDPDFNHDGIGDQDDYAALVNAIAGGPCPGELETTSNCPW